MRKVEFNFAIIRPSITFIIESYHLFFSFSKNVITYSFFERHHFFFDQRHHLSLLKIENNTQIFSGFYFMFLPALSLVLVKNFFFNFFCNNWQNLPKIFDSCQLSPFRTELLIIFLFCNSVRKRYHYFRIIHFSFYHRVVSCIIRHWILNIRFCWKIIISPFLQKVIIIFLMFHDKIDQIVPRC